MEAHPPRVAATIAAPPARWIDARGATVVGPELPAGTLVLLGGRRALVARNGALTAPREASPEPLYSILGVPTASGLGVVGLGASRAVYRFDDPLGGAALLGRIDRSALIAPGPGAVLAFSRDGLRLLDLDSGSPRALPGLPARPIAGAAFRSAQEGVVLFHGGAAVLTTDGGAVLSAMPDDPALSAVWLDGREIRALTRGGVEGVIDFAAKRFAPGAPPPHATGPLLLRWIRETHQDPLEASAARGIPLGEKLALAASPGALSRVDLETGAVLDLAAAPPGVCTLARAGGEAIAVCVSGDAPLWRTRVHRISTTPPLTVGAPVHEARGACHTCASASGGVLLDCAETAVVRQRDGRWMAFNVPAGVAAKNLGALADGRLAFVRGGADESAGILAMSDDGHEERVADVAWPSGKGPIEPLGPVVEDVDGTLRFFASRAGRIHLLVARAGAPSTALVPAAGAPIELAIVRGHIAVVWDGSGELLSMDDGRSWIRAPLPEGALAETSIGDLRADHRWLSDVGASVRGLVRLGWALATPRSPGSTGLVALPSQ